jgi:hypothetical protein
MERNTIEAAYTALVPFLRERLRAIPLQKLKLLTRWAQVCASDCDHHPLPMPGWLRV